MKLNKTKPPKNREFMGLVAGETLGARYWDFFWWATSADGLSKKAQYVDRGFFAMPKIIGWIEVPPVEAD